MRGNVVSVEYVGPERFDGTRWVEGDSFVLSGKGKGREGVELARGVGGLFKEPTEYRYNTSADFAGARYESSVAGRREILASVNILGNTPEEFRNNTRSWLSNHPEDMKGKLWFHTPEGISRYLEVLPTPTAGESSLDIDPSIRSLAESMEWGWVSDSPYFAGNVLRFDYDKEKKEFSFFNPSTTKNVYPKIYIEGPGTFGFNDGHFFSVQRGETARIDFNPQQHTFVKRNMSTDFVENMWPHFLGRRPKLQLLPEAINTVQMDIRTPKAWIEFNPLFRSWF